MPGFRKHCFTEVMLSIYLSAAAFAVDFKEPEYESVMPGLDFGKVQMEDPALVYFVVRAELGKEDYRVGSINAEINEALPDLSQRLIRKGEPLIAAINGDYFDMGSFNKVPWGVLVIDREVLFSPSDKKSAFVLDGMDRPSITRPMMRMQVSLGSASKWVRAIAVNRPRGEDEKGVFIYTPAWGGPVPGVAGGGNIVVKSDPLKAGETTTGEVTDIGSGDSQEIPGDGFVISMDRLSSSGVKQLRNAGKVKIKIDFKPDAREAIGGGPRIARSNRVSVEFSSEGFESGHRAYLENTRHPRSAIGYNSRKTHVFLCAVEGRTNRSDGLTMKELGELMLALGASDAMAFDGGGSVGMFLNGKMVTTQGGSAKDRILSNAVGVFSAKDGKR